MELVMEKLKISVVLEPVVAASSLAAGGIGKEASGQEGFNIGFKQSASSAYKWGIVRGITSAFVSLPDQFKEKLVKKLEDRGRFQSIYKPVQEISTDDALGMSHFQPLQENTQSH